MSLWRRFTSLVDGVIVGYGGSIDKHIGDAVMALFGAPRAMTTIRCALRGPRSISMRPWLDGARIRLARSKPISESPAAKSWLDQLVARTGMTIRSLATS